MITFLRREKLLIDIICKSIKGLAYNLKTQSKGQNVSDAVLKLSHQLEKGMCISNPRELWGWEKAYKIVNLFEDADDFAQQTSAAVLKEFIKRKKCSSSTKDVEQAELFSANFSTYYSNANIENGGVLQLSKSDFVFNIEEIERLFKNRHSIRDFDASPISLDDLDKAIELANRCPSACNRQSTNVYVISTDVWNTFTDDPNQVYNATQHILITGRRNAYSVDEINDWIVSASIFAAYLSLTLTLYGIGSCVIRKGLLNDNGYKQLKMYSGIPNEEKIILELAVGNLKEKFKVPVSNRRDVTDYAHYIK